MSGLSVSSGCPGAGFQGRKYVRVIGSSTGTGHGSGTVAKYVRFIGTQGLHTGPVRPPKYVRVIGNAGARSRSTAATTARGMSGRSVIRWAYRAAPAGPEVCPVHR